MGSYEVRVLVQNVVGSSGYGVQLLLLLPLLLFVCLSGRSGWVPMR